MYLSARFARAACLLSLGAVIGSVLLRSRTAALSIIYSFER